MAELLLNPGPTNTRFITKLYQWFGSDKCHREQDFKVILKDLQQKLLKEASFEREGKIAILCGSGTAAMESMIASLAPNGTLIINAGKYGQRAISIFNTYNIEHKVVKSKNIDDLIGCNKTRYVYFVENETSTGEKYSLKKLCDLYPNAQFFIDATSAFGASDYKLSHRIAALSFCSNKCLQSTPGLGIVIWNAQLKKFKRTYYGDLSKYGIDELPFTLPTQSIYALNYTMSKIDNKLLFDKRRNLLITELAKINIKCINKYPSNSIIAFKHPKMSYEELHDFLKKRKIVIYSGVEGIEKSFRISTMSVNFNKLFNKIIRSFNASCIH